MNDTDAVVYDEIGGEWIGAAGPAGAVAVRDAVGAVLADGDQETDRRFEGIEGLVLRAECVKKR